MISHIFHILSINPNISHIFMKNPIWIPVVLCGRMCWPLRRLGQRLLGGPLRGHCCRFVRPECRPPPKPTIGGHHGLGPYAKAAQQLGGWGRLDIATCRRLGRSKSHSPFWSSPWCQSVSHLCPKRAHQDGAYPLPCGSACAAWCAWSQPRCLVSQVRCSPRHPWASFWHVPSWRGARASAQRAPRPGLQLTAWQGTGWASAAPTTRWRQQRPPPTSRCIPSLFPWSSNCTWLCRHGTSAVGRSWSQGSHYGCCGLCWPQTPTSRHCGCMRSPASRLFADGGCDHRGLGPRGCQGIGAHCSLPCCRHYGRPRCCDLAAAGMRPGAILAG